MLTVLLTQILNGKQMRLSLSLNSLAQFIYTANRVGDLAVRTHRFLDPTLCFSFSFLHRGECKAALINTCTQFWDSLFWKTVKQRGVKLPTQQTLSCSQAALTPQCFYKLSSLHSQQRICWVTTMWPYPPPAAVWSGITWHTELLSSEFIIIIVINHYYHYF